MKLLTHSVVFSSSLSWCWPEIEWNVGGPIRWRIPDCKSACASHPFPCHVGEMSIEDVLQGFCLVNPFQTFFSVGLSIEVGSEEPVSL